MATRRKTTKNSQRKKVKIKRKKIKRKVKKINKIKLVLLFCIIGVFIFGASKAVVGVTTVAKEIQTKVQKEIEKQKAMEIEKQKAVESEKQLNLEEEQTEGIAKKYTIVLDPGHGGKDPGNLGYTSRQKGSTEKIYEKDICLDVSKKVAGILSRQNDIQVILTRTEDKYVELEERANLANTQNADALVSIHMNAEYGGDTAYGIETYYRTGASEESKKLANSVQNTIGSYVSMRDRGVRESIFQVLMNSSVPSILVECGFISNYKEEQKLLDEKYQNQLAEGISQGILTFLDENNK